MYTAGKGVPQKWPIVWLDSSGTFNPLRPTASAYLGPRFSPDGRRLVFFESNGHGIFVYDLQRDATMQLSSSSDYSTEAV